MQENRTFSDIFLMLIKEVLGIFLVLNLLNPHLQARDEGNFKHVLPTAAWSTTTENAALTASLMKNQF